MFNRTILNEGAKAQALLAVSRIDPSAKQKLVVIIKKFEDKRSLNANALYFKWCQIIADETGNDKDDIHEYLKTMFLGMKHVSVKPYLLGVEVPVSTKSQSVQSMAEYMMKIQAWAATDLNITLPSGDDALLNSLEDR